MTPERVMALPRMLASRAAPAVIRCMSLPEVLPWMLRAGSNLRRVRQREISDSLAALNLKAVPAWRELLAACNAGRLLRERGMIRLIRDARDEPKLAKLRARLAAKSLPCRVLNNAELKEMEPLVGRDAIGGLLHESDADVGDPLEVSLELLKRFKDCGGTLLHEEAVALRPGSDGTELSTNVTTHRAAEVIVTMGLQSSGLLTPLGITVPLQAERGYSIRLAGCGGLLQRPVTFQSESCVATPMGADLRLAGTVEFARVSTPPDWTRSERLALHARHYFDADLSPLRSDRWIGSRPSLPDSLPAIGRLPGASNIGYAFGHQHLGVTQAAISANLLFDMMMGKPTSVDCQPYDLARFAAGRAARPPNVVLGISGCSTGTRCRGPSAD